MGYADIGNLYKDQDVLLFRECYASEKIHGTSAHLTWDGLFVKYFSGGEDHEKFKSLFDDEELRRKFVEKIGVESAVVYGEAYGGKQQGMSATYGPKLKFVVFDVRIGESWLSMPQAEDVAAHLGLEFVYYRKIPTDLAAIDAERDSDSVQAVRNGMGLGHMREGVVLRPLIEVTKNNGKRIVAKHKRDEFAERQHVPKVVDADRQKVLDDAQAVADEWCVPMRLEHVLQEHPECVSMEQTSVIIKAMVADVYKEAKGDIVEGKEVATAIGKKAAYLWKERLKNALREKCDA